MMFNFLKKIIQIIEAMTVAYTYYILLFIKQYMYYYLFAIV